MLATSALVAFLISPGPPDPGTLRGSHEAFDRGVDVASLLRSGVAALEQDDPEGAAAMFRGVLEHDPDNVSATYDLALCADRMGNYHDAREGYLATLRLDRSYADARYNLALLTYRAGALPEARHHLDELASIAPDDPRIGPLRASLALERDAPSSLSTTTSETPTE